MRQDDRKRPRYAAPDMHEMDIKALDRGNKLWKLVQTPFRLAPIVTACPISDQIFDVIPVGAVAPIRGVKALGKARLAHPLPDAVNGGLRDIDSEWPTDRIECLRECAPPKYSGNHTCQVAPGYSADRVPAGK